MHNILNYENEKDLIWLDCLKTFTYANGFVLNLHYFIKQDTNESIYDIRIGLINVIDDVPVLSLLKTTDKNMAYNYFNNLTKNINNVYLFKNNN